MAYVYGKTKSRAGLTVTAAMAAPVVQPEATEEPAVEAGPRPDRRGRIPGRKRGPGKNNKHGSGCGTNNGYWAHKRAGDDACGDCLQARRDYNNGFKEVAKARRAA